MRGAESQLVIFCTQVRHPVAGLGCIHLNCWPRGSHENPQTTQAVAKTIVFSSQTDRKAPLLKVIPIKLIDREEVKLVST